MPLTSKTALLSPVWPRLPSAGHDPGRAIEYTPEVTRAGTGFTDSWKFNNRLLCRDQENVRPPTEYSIHMQDMQESILAI